MNGIILDCSLMRYPHSGLYHYCLNVSERVNAILARENGERVQMYLPSKEILPFDNSCHLIEKKWHRYWQPFLSNCKVWHAPFQSGRILPDKRKHKNTNILLTIHDLNPLHEGK